MQRPAAILLLGALLAGATGAQALEVGTPDGRARVVADGSVTGAGATLRAFGNGGAYGFDHTLEATLDYLHITNPPLAGGYRISREGFRVEYLETFGPYVARATVGTGGITEGVDAFGRVSNLGWPGPGMYEHVNYKTLSRGSPNQGVPANGGAFGGIGKRWLHPDFGWSVVSQRYASERSQTLVTELTDGAGTSVVITDVVDPVQDLVARNFRFACDGLPCTPAGFAHYANMNPTTYRAPRTPSIGDAATDDASDFATVYDAASSAMLHFRPYKVDPASLTRPATSYPSEETAREAVAGAFGPGVYIAIAGQEPARQFQAGLDTGGLLRAEGEDTPLLDPYYDLAGDGDLSGSVAAFGKTAGALGLPSDPDGSFTVHVTAAEDPAAALAATAGARARGFTAIRASSEAFWSDWTGRARMPATSDARTREVALRALMLIRTAMDRRTGAIVAAATTEFPYRQDWPRDGAFFNYALLLAGYPELAIQHADFYRRIYRLGGTWDSFYYPDGAEAGFAWPYEIDTQGFALWALWLPYEFGAAGLDYLGRVYPAIRDTADALLLCRDPRNAMQCPAAEDDASPFNYLTQGAQGAAIVHLALRTAVKAAEALGVDQNAREVWRARADELQAAALNPANGVCGASQCRGGRGGIYLVWPGRVLDPSSALAQSHLRQFVSLLDARSAVPPRDPAVGGSFAYPMEPLLALAPFWAPGNATREAQLDGWARWLTHRVAEPDLPHYGESIFRCDGQPPCAPGRTYLHTIFPHVWSGTEMYLAAAFVYGITGCPAEQKIGEAACRP